MGDTNISHSCEDLTAHVLLYCIRPTKNYLELASSNQIYGIKVATV